MTRVLLLTLNDVFFRQKLSLFSLAPHGDDLHVLDDPRESILIFLDFLVLFCSRQEDEARVSLAGSAFHLNKRFDRHQLVQANHLVAGRYIKTFLHHVRSNQNIDHTASKLDQRLFKFIFGHFHAPQARKTVLEMVSLVGFHVCGFVGFVHQVLLFSSHGEADLEFTRVEHTVLVECREQA